MAKKPPLPEHRRQPTEGAGGDPYEDVHPLVAPLLKEAADIKRKHFTRPVTTFTSIDGEEFRATVPDKEDIEVKSPSEVLFWLKTHDKKIAMTLGGILVAAGLIGFQRNRSQRKKMPKNLSSYRRKPRK